VGTSQVDQGLTGGRVTLVVGTMPALAERANNDRIVIGRQQFTSVDLACLTSNSFADWHHSLPEVNIYA
jgi:hypothetical protein